MATNAAGLPAGQTPREPPGSPLKCSGSSHQASRGDWGAPECEASRMVGSRPLERYSTPEQSRRNRPPRPRVKLLTTSSADRPNPVMATLSPAPSNSGRRPRCAGRRRGTGPMRSDVPRRRAREGRARSPRPTSRSSALPPRRRPLSPRHRTGPENAGRLLTPLQRGRAGLGARSEGVGRPRGERGEFVAHTRREGVPARPTAGSPPGPTRRPTGRTGSTSESCEVKAAPRAPTISTRTSSA